MVQDFRQICTVWRDRRLGHRRWLARRRHRRRNAARVDVVPTPPEVIQDVTVRNVKDDEGRAATFRIMLFSDEFRWRINSFDAVEQAANARSSRRR